MYYACLMCKCGDADGAVSGACHSTGNTIRPALQLLKTKPGISSVSGFFLMEVPDCEFGENGLFVFADCAVSPDYDSEKLAEVAKLSSDSFKSFVGKDAKVAMLSFSSYGSAKHDRVTMVADAVKNAITTGFKPDSCPFQNLGEEFGKWLEEVDAFSTDQLGNPRDKNAMWPGAYQK